MNKDVYSSVLRDSWYLLAMFVVIVGFAAYKYVAHASDEITGVEARRAPGVTAIAAPENVAARGKASPARVRPSLEEQTRKDIRDSERKVEEAPDSPDAPAYLRAMGNLYKQRLKDNKEAVRCYMLILTDYPDWRDKTGVYLEMADSYGAMGDSLNEMWIYKTMMKEYAPDSQEYLFAQDKLNLRGVQP